MVAKKLRRRLARVGAKTLHITPGSSWEDGVCESFNGKLRNELLNGEIFYTLREAQVLIEQWRQHYDRVPPYSAHGYRPPAPETTAAHYEQYLARNANSVPTPTCSRRCAHRRSGVVNVRFRENCSPRANDCFWPRAAIRAPGARPFTQAKAAVRDSDKLAVVASLPTAM